MLGRVLSQQGATPAARQALQAAVTHLSNTVDPAHPAAQQAQNLLVSIGSP